MFFEYFKRLQRLHSFDDIPVLNIGHLQHVPLLGLGLHLDSSELSKRIIFLHSSSDFFIELLNLILLHLLQLTIVGFDLFSDLLVFCLFVLAHFLFILKLFFNCFLSLFFFVQNFGNDSNVVLFLQLFFMGQYCL